MSEQSEYTILYLQTLEKRAAQKLNFNNNFFYTKIASSFLSVTDACSIDTSGIYSSFTVENIRLCRAMASLIIGEDGQFNHVAIHECILFIKDHRYTLSWGTEESQARVDHLFKQLTFLQNSQDAQQLIKKVTRPYANRLAEQAIKDTVQLSNEASVTDKDTKRAVIISFLVMLRQSLGSCFATAPAILIQKEQPLVFLKDIELLLSTSQLKKIVEGNEFFVPMSRTWGNGDLKKPLNLCIPLHLSVNPIWISPLLLKAFEEKNISINQDQIQKIIEKHFFQQKEIKQGTSFYTSVNDIIDLILQAYYNIKEKDIPQTVLQQSKQQALLSLSLSENRSASQVGLHHESNVANSVKKQKKEEKETKNRHARLYRTTSDEIKRYIKMEGECALLKLWEFTIASFAEIHHDLSRWNFYSSLGINWDDEGGIGQVLYTIAKDRVDETNKELEEHKHKFNAINIELTYLEQRARQASTEQEINWTKMEYQSRKTEQYHLQQLCDMISEKTKKIANVHQFLIHHYDKLLKEYFQEVYDPDLHDVNVGIFDDAPAGFRLIYKHGRSNPSLWSVITTFDEYIDALASFFTITEQELTHLPEIVGIEREFSLIITQIVSHIRSTFFQETALNRTLLSHGLQAIKNPLHHIHLLEKKPWVFTSGGSMNSLITAYFKLEGQIEEAARWVENETELFAFLIDTVRLSYNRYSFSASSYRKRLRQENSDNRVMEAEQNQINFESFLMHSPTHAFRLLPQEILFQKAWTSDTYSYSWINNYLTIPGQSFFKETLLSPQDGAQIIEDIAIYFSYLLPEDYIKLKESLYASMYSFMRVFDFAKVIKEVLQRDQQLKKYSHYIIENAELDAFLYSYFPYTSVEQLTELLDTFFVEEKNIQPATMILYKEWKEVLYTIRKNAPIPAKDVLQIFYSCCVDIFQSNYYSYDVAKEILFFLRKKKAFIPNPIIVADSNWIKEYFAFVISPISCEIEFWAVSKYGTVGKPIPHWKKWLNGSNATQTWGVLLNPLQYVL